MKERIAAVTLFESKVTGLTDVNIMRGFHVKKYKNISWSTGARLTRALGGQTPEVEIYGFMVVVNYLLVF